MTVKSRNGSQGGGGVAGGEARSMIILLSIEGRATRQRALDKEGVFPEVDKKCVGRPMTCALDLV